MTKQKALMIMLAVIDECQKHNDTQWNCQECVFGKASRCLVSGGNDIPTDWLVNEKICEWMGEEE